MCMQQVFFLFLAKQLWVNIFSCGLDLGRLFHVLLDIEGEVVVLSTFLRSLPWLNSLTPPSWRGLPSFFVLKSGFGLGSGAGLFLVWASEMSFSRVASISAWVCCILLSSSGSPWNCSLIFCNSRETMLLQAASSSWYLLRLKSMMITVSCYPQSFRALFHDVSVLGGGLGICNYWQNSIQPCGIVPSLTISPKRVTVFFDLSIVIWKFISAFFLSVSSRWLTKASGETSGLEGLFKGKVKARPGGAVMKPGQIWANRLSLKVLGLKAGLVGSRMLLVTLVGGGGAGFSVLILLCELVLHRYRI